MLFGVYLLIYSVISCFIYFIIYSMIQVFNFDRKYILYLIYNLFFCITLTFFYYLYLNSISDFSYITIQKSSNIYESLFYKLTGSWSNHEGSILLWLWLLAGYIFFHSLLKKTYNFFYIKYINYYLIIILMFFLFFITFSTNPFLKNKILNFNGLQLNPLLQDFTLSIHPPILYLGYLGYALIFAYILLFIRLNYFIPMLFNKIKLILLFSWSFLTLGILLGSWWAYYELGWGGWWFWDPVENISLFPWVLSVIYIHLFQLILKQRSFLIYLYIAGLSLFFLIIFGVFFVRSGLLTSVHVFAIDYARGQLLLYFVCFLGVLCLSHLILNFSRIPPSLNIKKLNYSLIFNIVIFSLLLILLIFGTFFPTFLKLFFEKTLIIGTQYFNEITLTFLVGISFIFLFASCYQINLNFYLSFYLLNSVVIYITLDLCCFTYFYFYLLYFLQVFWSLCIYLYLKTFNLSNVTHLLFITFIILVLNLTSNSFEYFNIFRPGDFLYFLQFFLIFRGINIINNYNYYTLFGNFLLSDWFHLNYLSLIFPEKRFYFLEKFSGIKANIISNYFSDIYLIIGDGQIISGWFIHIIYNPGMPLLWLCGCSIVLFFWYFIVKGVIYLNIKYTNLLLW
jgi:c-type cytochrome biogenesis protein CcmF